MRKVFLAKLETRHFTFRAYGGSAIEAKETMIEALRRHSKQYAVSFSELMAAYSNDIEVHEIVMGSAYRDNQQF
jgi:hypothetical protein